MKALRILHCPTTVGGNAPNLARSERKLGLQSWAVALEQNYFSYQVDEVLLEPNANPMQRESARWRLLWRALTGADIVHFNFGRSVLYWGLPRRISFSPGYLRVAYSLYRVYAAIFELRDLSLLKHLGKGIVVTYQGDDARQGDYCQAHFEINSVREAGYYSPESDALKRHAIKAFDRYADRIYALNPDLLHVLPSRAQFMPYAHIDLREWQPAKQTVNSREGSKPPVILHAPSHRGAKGTRFILEAISRLQREGIPFEFKLVEGMSHAEAHRLYGQADLLLDQLLCGWYGGLAVELMALGKPVICYIREGDLKFIPEAMRKDIPIINATPATIYTVLKEWLTERRHELREVGERSRTYVERWHDPLTIVAKLKEDYEAIMASKQQRGL